MRDKAGKQHWDETWSSTFQPHVIDPHKDDFRNRVIRELHAYYRSTFEAMVTKEKNLLEIGCARSEWLPYFATEFGFRVSGLDYSELGCEHARRSLDHAGVRGTVVHGDAFAPPEEMVGRFDVVVSLGVLEHFDDTVGAVRAFARFLKPGGLLVTGVPNMSGIVGTLQKFVDRDIYDIHVPLTRETLGRAHGAAGLGNVRAEYVAFLNFGVVNMARHRGSLWKRTFVLKPLTALSLAGWLVADRLPMPRPNGLIAPYVYCHATK